MLLITHVIIAITSILVTALTVVNPNKEKLHISIMLAALTIASGTILVVAAAGSPLLQSCMTGLGYLSVMLIAISASYYRLIHSKNNIRNI